ncbi:hypothetical protein Clacol_004116 [Clathrus columnatus]|uniref:Protein kinase domain-containing protein n=1 Tax=Clathrus columnatus TaxID=1419009 RepID=A0AAV5A8A2_9AGAM|nr:hypothetical protein Clacol_004116 [Clathrus columnatus]
MLPCNALSSVTVHGLVFRDGVSIPQTFQKGTSRQGRVYNFQNDYFKRPGGLSVHPLSSLTSPGNEHLSISLGETLGYGRIGTVHEANLLTRESNLPPLVMKISRHKRSAHVEQETWFYEELEQVQGIAVPRCYGLFQAHINAGSEVSVWKEERKHRSREFEKSEESDESSQSSESDYGAPKFDWDIPNSKGGIVPVFPPPDPTLITILLLERLGERMPMEEPLDTIEPDVYEIYNDISRLGIEHLDIRWSNILSVQDPDHQPPENVCPNHGHAHRWRIVDFDLARKADGRVDYLDSCAESWLERLFTNLPRGVVVEPWD